MVATAIAMLPFMAISYVFYKLRKRHPSHPEVSVQQIAPYLVSVAFTGWLAAQLIITLSVVDYGLGKIYRSTLAMVLSQRGYSQYLLPV